MFGLFILNAYAQNKHEGAKHWWQATEGKRHDRLQQRQPLQQISRLRVQSCG